MICGYLYHSSLINPLFSKLVSFSINKKTNITVIFFFSKTFNSNLKLIQQKTTNQSINQLIPFSNISLFEKKRSKCSNNIQKVCCWKMSWKTEYWLLNWMNCWIGWIGGFGCWYVVCLIEEWKEFDNKMLLMSERMVVK